MDVDDNFDIDVTIGQNEAIPDNYIVEIEEEVVEAAPKCVAEIMPALPDGEGKFF